MLLRRFKQDDPVRIRIVDLLDGIAALQITDAHIDAQAEGLYKVAAIAGQALDQGLGNLAVAHFGADEKRTSGPRGMVGAMAVQRHGRKQAILAEPWLDTKQSVDHCRKKERLGLHGQVPYAVRYRPAVETSRLRIALEVGGFRGALEGGPMSIDVARPAPMPPDLFGKSWIHILMPLAGRERGHEVAPAALGVRGARHEP